jgi:hypothetical protein
VRCIPGGGAGAGAGGGADLVVLEKEKQPELNVAAARTSPRDRNFIMLVLQARTVPKLRKCEASRRQLAPLGRAGEVPAVLAIRSVLSRSV